MTNEKIMDVKIDYLSVTFPLEVHVGDVKELIIQETVDLVSNFLNIPKSLRKKEPKATNRYKYQYLLGEAIILRLVGPEDSTGFQTCQLELKGEGCREYENRNPNKTWKQLILFLKMINCKTTRIDIALDDFSNQLPLSWIDRKIDKKYYTSSIKSKGKPIGRIEEGYSLTLGSNESPLQICIYDKKYEQAERGKVVLEDNWTRYEMRFRRDKAHLIFRELYNNLDEANEKESLKKFAFGLLLQNLDIKEDNNYSQADQKKVDTDKKWLNFLNNTQKYVLPKLEKKDVSIDLFMQRYEKSSAYYLLFLYLINGRDKESFEHKVYQMLYDNLELDKAKYHRLNLYLEKLDIPEVSDKSLEEIKTEFFNEITERELPF